MSAFRLMVLHNQETKCSITLIGINLQQSLYLRFNARPGVAWLAGGRPCQPSPPPAHQVPPQRAGVQRSGGSQHNRGRRNPEWLRGGHAASVGKHRPHPAALHASSLHVHLPGQRRELHGALLTPAGRHTAGHDLLQPGAVHQRLQGAGGPQDAFSHVVTFSVSDYTV